MSTDLAYAILGQLGRDRRADDSLIITGGNDPVFVTPGASPAPGRRRWARWVSLSPICGGFGPARFELAKEIS